MDNDDYIDNWIDTDDGIDYRTVNFDLITLNNPALETKLKQVATRINELDMHVQYQRYLDACDIEDPPCEPIEVYSDFEAWFKKTYIDATKSYCKEYGVPYNLFYDFKNLYQHIYALKQSEQINKSSIMSKYSDPFHPDSN